MVSDCISGLHFNTFKRRAIKFDCYETNQSGKGVKKTRDVKFKTEDILSGRHPHYQTHKLKIRLINEGYMQEKCNCCGITEWMGERLPFEMNHIDGNRTNHSLNNLELLCPNCHSQTSTWRARNIK